MLGYKSDDKNDPGLHLRECSRRRSRVTVRVFATGWLTGTCASAEWTLATNVSLYAPAPNSVDFELPADLVSRDS